MEQLDELYKQYPLGTQQEVVDTDEQTMLALFGKEDATQEEEVELDRLVTEQFSL